jgi:hypothetical protein
MSAYITLATPMTDQQCLLEALADLGFDSTKVEVFEQAEQLQGYQGDRRQQRAHVIIRRQFVGSASNDIGFERTETGFRAYVSGFDHPRFGNQWLDQLRNRYQVHHETKLARLAEAERQRQEEERRRLVESQRQAIHKKAKSMGYRVQETRQGDKLRLVLVKRVY